MKLKTGLPVFQLAGQSFTVNDVLTAARIWGIWQEIEERAHEGLACLNSKERIAEDFDLDQAVETAAEEYRYERNLVAAEEMEAWLKSRNLVVEEWMQYIEHTVLQNHFAELLDEITSDFHPDPEQLREYSEIYLICSGDFRKIAGRLARQFAFCESLKEKRSDFLNVEIPQESQDAAVNRILRCDAVIERFKSEYVTSKVIEDEIHSNSMEWVQYGLKGIRFLEEPAALEAAMCIREDEMSISDVANDAGVEMEKVEMYFGEMASTTQNQFFSAQEGELIGPFIDETGNYALFQVTRRSLPDKSDPAIREKAEERFLARLMTQEMNNRVKWLREL